MSFSSRGIMNTITDDGVVPTEPAALRAWVEGPGADAEAHSMLRVIDEDKSEPDGYLYPASTFAPIELPEVAQRALMAADD